MRKLWWVVLVACGGSQAGQVPVAPVPAPAVAAPVASSDPARGPAPAAPVTHAWPATRVGTVVDAVHGKQVADPYRWLEDEASPEVQAWMAAQDGYARAELAKSPHRDEIAARLTQLYYYDSISAPVHRGSRLFYTRKHADKEKRIVYWKQGEAGAEHSMLDPNQWSTDGSSGLNGWWPSWDGKTVVYGVSEHNADEAVFHVLDVATGVPLPDVIGGVKFSSPSWTPDGRSFYYVWLPPVSDQVSVADRSGFAEVKLHKLGTKVASDPTIYPANHDPTTGLGATVSRDGHWLLVTVQHGWNSSDYYFRDLRKPAAGWTTLVAGADGTFDVTAWRDQFYVTTNQGAPRSRVYKVDPGHLDRASWREIVPQNDAALELAAVVGDRLVLTYLRNAARELEVHDLAGALIRKVELPIGSMSGISGDPDDDTGYIDFTSFTEPEVIYKTSLKTGALAEWARIKLPLDTSQVVTEQVMFASKDGTKIPMFLLSKRGTKHDGTNPTILTGYGGFNVAQTPAYSTFGLTWLERGGVYAIAGLRGGGEYGEDWHRAGMLGKKQNVFDDFVAAAEYLIAQRWTSADHLGITGGSNGGLLVGAAVTQRPELFKAVRCAVPLLDMLRYHLFGLGKTWIPEYGSAEDAEQFTWLYAYSPYRVAVDAGKRAYPTVLFDSADHDDRVDPMHARKLAAMLQAAQTAAAPILLRIERNSGHGGADVVKQRIERTADELGMFDRLLR